MSTIFIVKETRKGEQRVALVPDDVRKVKSLGHQVIIESDAGLAAGFSDNAYKKAGGEIRKPDEQLTDLFHNVDLVLRVKRAQRAREILENKTLSPTTLMIGFLDPLDQTTPHISEWENCGVSGLSLDQLQLSDNDPINILAVMSELTGSIALDHMIKICQRPSPQKLVVLGTGAVGKSAIRAGVKKNLSVLAIGRQETHRNEIENLGAKYSVMPENKSEQLTWIQKHLKDADLVLCSARQRKMPAPILINKETLSIMQKGTVVADLARTEGGNVEGSMNDKTLILGNDVIVTNNTGYPKQAPYQASIAYSNGMVHLLKKLTKDQFQLDKILSEGKCC